MFLLFTKMFLVYMLCSIRVLVTQQRDGYTIDDDCDQREIENESRQLSNVRILSKRSKFSTRLYQVNDKY